MMILTAHQPVYLPWLGLFHKIALADHFVYFDDVQYQTRDWNNRNKIKTASGDIWLTVPVLSKNHFETKVKDVLINNDIPWRRKHFNSITLAYRKARYFDKYLGFFEEVYARDWEKLSDLNEYMLKSFLTMLNIQVDYSRLSDDSFSSRKSDLVLDMCRKLKADLYIFGALGKDYADRESFQKAGIEVYFQDYQHPVYEQLHGEFIPNMSIIDLLFNHGDKSLEILQANNLLREDLLKNYFKESK